MLQSKENIDSLPDRVGDQLLLLAKLANEGVRNNKYDFVHLAKDSEFEHFGMMKKIEETVMVYIQHLSVFLTQTTGLVFLHPTLQEYLSALYESLFNEGNFHPLHWHSDLGLPLPSNNEDTVLGFLAGLCKHSSTFSCQQVGDFVFTLEATRHQVTRCVYESGSIAQKSQKIQERFINSNEIIYSNSSGLPFDYYLIGHFICHHGGMWSTTISSNEEQINKLFVQALKFCDNPKGKLLRLSISNFVLSELDPLFVSDVQHLLLQRVTFTASSVNMIRKCISSDGALRKILVFGCEQVELLLPIVFESSLLDKVHIVNTHHSIDITDDTMNLLMNNSNIQYLRLQFPLKLPAHTVCHSKSLDFLAKRLLVFSSFKHTLPNIKISHQSSEFDVSLFFLKDSNREPKMEFTIFIRKSCDFNVTQQILASLPEQSLYLYLYLYSVLLYLLCNLALLYHLLLNNIIHCSAQLRMTVM